MESSNSIYCFSRGRGAVGRSRSRVSIVALTLEVDVMTAAAACGGTTIVTTGNHHHREDPRLAVDGSSGCATHGRQTDVKLIRVESK